MSDEINIQDLPDDLTVKQLLEVIRAQGKILRVTIESKPTVKRRRPNMTGFTEEKKS